MNYAYNYMCNKLEKAGMRYDIPHNATVHHMLSTKQITMFIDDKKVTSSVGYPLRNAISRKPMRSHLASNKCLSPNNFYTVDWDSLEQR